MLEQKIQVFKTSEGGSKEVTDGDTFSGDYFISNI